IRDRTVTGVQTCALPILLFYLKYEERVSAEIPVPKRKPRRKSRKQFRNDSPTRFSAIWLIAAAAACLAAMMTKETTVVLPVILRSEERRVGKECKFRRVE